MKQLLGALLVSISCKSAMAVLPANLPEFKSEPKMTRNSQIVRDTNPFGSIFYTGKPYENDQERYLFLARSLDSEASLWTSGDPSGFPDGANNHRYAPIPTSQLDSKGLFTISGSTTPNQATDSISSLYTVTGDTISHTDSTNSVPSYSGWNFVDGGNLGGTLTINGYGVIGYGSAFTGGIAGADLNVSYSGSGQYTWLQVITTNDRPGNPLGMGSMQTYFDLSPYTSIPVTVSPDNTTLPVHNPSFSDFSWRPISHIAIYGLSSITWSASLYLIEINDFTNTITIHDGIKWGYSIVE